MKKIYIWALIALTGLGLSSCESESSTENEIASIVKNVSITNKTDYTIETQEGDTISVSKDKLSYSVQKGDYITYDKQQQTVSKLNKYKFSDTFWGILLFAQMNYWLGFFACRKERD